MHRIFPRAQTSKERKCTTLPLLPLATIFLLPPSSQTFFQSILGWEKENKKKSSEGLFFSEFKTEESRRIELSAGLRRPGRQGSVSGEGEEKEATVVEETDIRGEQFPADKSAGERTNRTGGGRGRDPPVSTNLLPEGGGGRVEGKERPPWLLLPSLSLLNHAPSLSPFPSHLNRRCWTSSLLFHLRRKSKEEEEEAISSSSPALSPEESPNFPPPRYIATFSSSSRWIWQLAGKKESPFATSERNNNNKATLACKLLLRSMPQREGLNFSLFLRFKIPEEGVKENRTNKQKGKRGGREGGYRPRETGKKRRRRKRRNL